MPDQGPFLPDVHDVPHWQNSNRGQMAASLQHLQRGAAAVQAGAVLAAIRLQRPKEYSVPPGCLDSVPPATHSWPFRITVLGVQACLLSLCTAVVGVQSWCSHENSSLLGAV